MGLLSRQALFLVFVGIALFDCTLAASRVAEFGWLSTSALVMFVALAFDGLVLHRLWALPEAAKPAPEYEAAG